MRRILAVVLLASLPASAAPKSAHPEHYRQVARFTLGGQGFWDYLTYDPAGDRLFIAHNQSVLVVAAADGKRLGEIPADGVHGIALVPARNRGFLTNGRAGTVTVFDLTTLKPIAEIKAGENPDAVIYDPHSDRVLVMNGRSHDLMAIDPGSLQVVATVPLGGKLEFATADAEHVYVNVEDTAEIAVVNSKTWKAEQRWKLAGCEEPTGLALDPGARRLFTACGNAKMLALDAATGRVVAAVPTGYGTDGAVFDAEQKQVLTANGEGTLTVIREGKGEQYELVGNVATQRGARTLALDPRSHRIFLVTAELGPPAPGERRPTVKPGTFSLLVYAPAK